MDIRNIKKRTKLFGMSLLFWTSFIWGFAFVGQSTGMRYMGPFSFNASRFLLAGCILIPIRLLFLHISPKKEKNRESKEAAEIKKQSIRGGIFCGLCLFAGSSLQQIGLQYTTVGKAGFISALYIIIIPIIGIFMGKKSRPGIWGAVFIALIGMYLLCIREEIVLSRGDGLMLACAFAFSAHILVIERVSVRIDAVLMVITQFFVCGLLSLFPALFLESPQAGNILAAWRELIFVGIFSGGIAFTAQIVGQRYVKAGIASLIMSLESVFSLIGGWLILGEILSKREIIGCVLVFLSILLAQKEPESREERVCAEAKG